jgi:hypothetical protein
MNIKTTTTWMLLIALTIASALVSKQDGKYIVLLILILSVFKFLGIAFQFIELKKAHSFWKTALSIYIFLFIVIISTIIY